MMDSHNLHYRADIVVVGAGAAGCVAASRLSENRNLRVLLVEAGRNLPPGQETASIRDVYSFTAAFDRRNHWPDLKAWTWRPQPGHAPRNYEQARIMGGGTSINGQQASIGIPADYDDWAASGASGWAWSDVSPWFEKLAGKDGVFPVSTVAEELWPPFARSFARVAENAGNRRLSDPNAESIDGWFSMPTMSDGQTRTSAAKAYLPDAVRSRPNLEIVTDATVETVEFDGRSATGVRIVVPGGRSAIAAERVVLAAGAIGTPLLLQRSGVGPEDWLEAAGIRIRHRVDGVGRNLQEHPSFALSGLLAPGMARGMTPRRHIVAAMRFSSTVSQVGPSDLYIVAVNRAAWHAVGWRIASLFGWVNKPLSRGWVRPSGPRGESAPEVVLNMLDHPDDLARLGEVARRMYAFMSAMKADGTLTDIGLPVAGAAFRAFTAEGVMRALAMHAAAQAMDRSKLARRAVLKSFEPVGSLFEAGADEALRTILHDRVAPGWHPVGTCRMGPADDPAAVVDPVAGAVHGIDGLHVVDASVMPSIPRANTALPTLMIAEKLSDAIGRAAG